MNYVVPAEAGFLSPGTVPHSEGWLGRVSLPGLEAFIRRAVLRLPKGQCSGLGALSKDRSP